MPVTLFCPVLVLIQSLVWIIWVKECLVHRTFMCCFFVHYHHHHHFHYFNHYLHFAFIIIIVISLLPQRFLTGTGFRTFTLKHSNILFDQIRFIWNQWWLGIALYHFKRRFVHTNTRIILLSKKKTPTHALYSRLTCGQPWFDINRAPFQYEKVLPLYEFLIWN